MRCELHLEMRARARRLVDSGEHSRPLGRLRCEGETKEGGGYELCHDEAGRIVVHGVSRNRDGESRNCWRPVRAIQELNWNRRDIPWGIHSQFLPPQVLANGRKGIAMFQEFLILEGDAKRRSDSHCECRVKRKQYNNRCKCRSK